MPEDKPERKPETPPDNKVARTSARKAAPKADLTGKPAAKPPAPAPAPEKKPRRAAKKATPSGAEAVAAPEQPDDKRSGESAANVRPKRAPRGSKRVTPVPSQDLAVPGRDRRALLPEPLSILMITPEAHPYAKTGGLAEVTTALADALARLGHSVSLVLPRYRGLDVAGAARLQTRVRLGDRLQPVAIFERRVSDRLTVALVDVPDLFDREALYGTASGDYPDNAWRFAVFSRAALEYARVREWRPSVIHAHDWQSGLAPVYQKMHLAGDPFVGGVPAVFTLHNLAFQGVFPPSTLASIGLGPEVLHVQAMEFWGSISYLKGGINFSEKITTVSPGYAREIVQPELGFGLDGVLARRSGDLVGILNGIDTSRWTPAADPYLATPFGAESLALKREAKRALLTDVGLPADEHAMSRPLIGLISRLTEQKGFDLIAAAADDLMALDAAWVMLGSGERRFEDGWRALAARHPDRVSATIGFDERLAHLIEAGADMFLMPSRFEPCGLNQMYSLRYGTVPIVRATGGLNDTVVDADDFPAEGTGFKFPDYTPGALLATIERALAAWRDAGRWQAIQRRGMQQDHSWDASAAEYVKLYVSAAGSEGGR
jgi:starch synthase